MSKEAKLERVRRRAAAKADSSQREEDWIKEFVAIARELGQPLDYIMDMDYLKYKEIRDAFVGLTEERKTQERRGRTSTLG